MSIEAVGRALSAPIGGNCKVVLLGVANHAHRDGTNAYPSIETLALYAHCDRRTAQRNVRKLEDEGFLEREGVGPMGQTRWRIAFAAWEGGGKMPQGQNARGGTSAPGGAAPVPPEPSIEPLPLSENSLRLGSEQTSNGHLDAQLVAREVGESEPPPTNLFGRPMPPSLVADALSALACYCEQTGQRVKPYTARGKPSESLTRILRAMVDHPEVRTLYRRMIERTLAVPWWEGDPQVGVIFGPGAVDQSLQRAMSRTAPASNGRGLTPSGRAIAKLLAADGG